MTMKNSDLSHPKDGGNEADNANVHAKLKPEWKKRPAQYPEAGEQLGEHDTGKKS